LTAQVHIGLRSGNRYFIAGYLARAGSGFALLFIETYTMCFGKIVEAHEAHIMVVVGITPPRVT